MKSQANVKGTGAGLLGVGMAFQVLAMNGQPALMGVGMAFLALGIAFLAKSRRCAKP